VHRQTDRQEVKMAKRLVAATCVVIVALAMIAGVGYGIWRLMLLVPPNAARAWALAATVLLPVSVFVTWRLALRYAAGLVHGIDTGISKVAKAGAEAANLRVHIHHALKQKPEPPTVVLPEVEIVPRRKLPDGNIIEL